MTGKKKWIENNYKNFNQQITMDFGMTRFGPYFQKAPILVIFYYIEFFPPLTSMSKNCLDGSLSYGLY
jgi:hypothetical protein